MAEIFYLEAGEEVPEFPDGEFWISIEASDDGRFFGTGWAQDESGKGVFYVSLPEEDVDLERSVNAARRWADRHGIARIWVQKHGAA